MDPALPYVAINRAKAKDGVLLEHGIDYEAFKYEETRSRIARRSDYERRQRQKDLGTLQQQYTP